jgi:hypothetical protein
MVASSLCGAAAVASIGYEPWQDAAAGYPLIGDERSMLSLPNMATGIWADAFDAYIAALPSARLP